MSMTTDLKSTLNLPRTDFPMKANLPQSEPRQLEAWDQSHLYERIQQARAGAPTYVLHDGPPYPTGEITLGTGLNKVLKDMVVKSKTMAGFRAPYVPGWDCHGLPIETKVEKELGGKGKVPPAEFRRRCREFADRFIENHRREFKRLGIFGLWENPYLTMSFDYEAAIADAFVTFLEKGYVYRGLKPVFWCIFDATALAEAEVEYEDHTSPSIWVRYRFYGTANASFPSFLRGHGDNLYAIIWTTTPWTLPASMALAFHPSFDYAAIEADDGNVYLMADALKESILKECHLRAKSVLGICKGRELEYSFFDHPFIDRGDPRFPNKTIQGVLGEHVTLDTGSGIVHTAPGHGAEDFYVGQKYSIQPYAPLDDSGHFTQGLPEYKGLTVFEANPAIVKLLRDRGALLGEGKLTHSYPHCWRCHNPVIFRATEQWFINLEHPTQPEKEKSPSLREKALSEAAGVKWIPAWGKERISKMISTRPDWCVSRQRFWGVPLIVFHCKKCGDLLRNIPALRHVVDWFRREGADAWFVRPASELLPAGTKCGKCNAADFEKENDILDVWFDSGSSHYAVLERYGMPWPADCYLEGPDQFRGWFQSSLLVAVGLRNAAPYRTVVTHGWTLDEKGTPMSKSLGNAIYPAEIYQRWGADLMRVWVASQDYTADVNLSESMMTQLSEAYRKIRNTFRFALSNLADFDPQRDALPDEQLDEFDRWLLTKTHQLVNTCLESYEAFQFHRVFHDIHDFCVVDLSAYYFDVLKDRLYTRPARGPERRSAQTAVYRISSALLRLLAPILVFTSEEIWKQFPRGADDPESVHLTRFPGEQELFVVDFHDYESNPPLQKVAAWRELEEVRRHVLHELESARNSKLINSALEAKVVLRAEVRLAQVLRQYASRLPALFIVSQVKVIDLEGTGSPASLQVEVARADGAKCERCWNYSTHVGKAPDYPTLCERCLPVVRELLGGAAAAS